MLTITTNIQSLISQRSLSKSTQLLNQAIERMSTGYKLNHASDNAANYSISTNMTTKLGAYQVAEDNAAMGLDMLTTANDSLNLISDHLVRIRALAEQAANGTYGAQSLEAINSEVNARVDEIERLYSTAEYNGIKLFGEVEESKFLKDIVRRDTSNMTKLSEVNEEITSGTYSISTAEELAKLAEMTNNGLIKGGEFVLANDIDLSSISNWVPIGDTWYLVFNGIFDGNGYKVINLKIDNPKDMPSGLFGVVGKAGIIKNVGCENAVIKGTSYSVCIIGTCDGIMENCYASESDIQSNSYGGAIIGELYGSCRDSYSLKVDLSSSSRTGGITSLIHLGAEINNCYAFENNNGKSPSIFAGCVTDANVSSKTPVKIINCGYIDNSGLRLYYTLPNCDVILENITQYSSLDELSFSDINKGNYLNLQVGTKSQASSQIGFEMGFNLQSLEKLRVNDVNNLTRVDNLLSTISSKQTEYGAAQNRLESALDEILTQYENILSSRSTLKDADVAKVSSQYIQQQILQQASATLMSTANQTPALALQLL